ncbi:hypothetical protein Pint_06867 [Pistacia integerrima]|uniref:Uncharacterized protein n=1 Tax=Pistacia integerrima TaxID=434235 RepID=A0ACC0XZ50_9ROSI|nr:hypothetical protein Pint_06867 [Pistacia integerrima]
MLITTINSMENYLVSAKSDTKLLREEAEKMNKEKGQICAQILAKQRKIASLESDSSTLNQDWFEFDRTREMTEHKSVKVMSKWLKLKVLDFKEQAGFSHELVIWDLIQFSRANVKLLLTFSFLFTHIGTRFMQMHFPSFLIVCLPSTLKLTMLKQVQ